MACVFEQTSIYPKCIFVCFLVQDSKKIVFLCFHVTVIKNSVHVWSPLLSKQKMELLSNGCMAPMHTAMQVDDYTIMIIFQHSWVVVDSVMLVPQHLNLQIQQKVISHGKHVCPFCNTRITQTEEGLGESDIGVYLFISFLLDPAPQS